MGETTNKVTAILIPPTKLHNLFENHRKPMVFYFLSKQCSSLGKLSAFLVNNILFFRTIWYNNS